MSARISVSIIEDDPDMRAVWRRKLARLPDFTVLDEFADAETALAQLGHGCLVPHILIVDYHLGEGHMDGITFVPKIKLFFPALCCLVITAYDELSGLPAAAARAGAAGVIYKSEPLAHLPARLHAAYAGQFPLSAKAAQYLFAELQPHAPAAAHADLLTKREIQVLLLLDTGKTAKEIGIILALSEDTIASYRKSAFKKLAVHKLPEALHKLRAGGGGRDLSEPD